MSTPSARAYHPTAPRKRGVVQGPVMPPGPTTGISSHEPPLTGPAKWEGGVETRVARLEATTEATERALGVFRDDVNRRFDSVDKRFDSVDKQFDVLRDEMDRRFGSVDKQFDSVDRRFDSLMRDMRLLLSLFVGGFLILAGLIAHGFKWF